MLRGRNKEQCRRSKEGNATMFLKEVALRSNDGGLQNKMLICFFITTLSLLLRKIQLPSKGAFDIPIYSDIKSNVILSETKDLTIVKILRFRSE